MDQEPTALVALDDRAEQLDLDRRVSSSTSRSSTSIILRMHWAFCCGVVSAA